MKKINYFKYLKRFILFGLLFCHLIQPLADEMNSTDTFNQQRSLRENGEEPIVVEMKEPVVCAVIDSGIDYNHPDLQPYIWTNPNEIPDNGIDDDGNGCIDDIHGCDFTTQSENGKYSGDPMDTCGHGTQVAGILAGLTQESVEAAKNISFVGIDNPIQIMPLRVILDGITSFNGVECGGLETETLIAALKYVKQMGIKCINMSIYVAPSDNEKKELQNIIQDLASEGTIMIGSAGSDFRTNNDLIPHYPASFVPEPDNMLSVCSVDQDSTLSIFSNYGQYSVNLCALGNKIRSTFLNNGYSTNSGTSMAAPFVTNAVALLWSAFPHLTAAEVKAHIMDSVDKVPELAGTSVTGGRLNLHNAIAHVSEKQPIYIEVSPSSGLVPLTVKLEVRGSLEAVEDYKWIATKLDGSLTELAEGSTTELLLTEPGNYIITSYIDKNGSISTIPSKVITAYTPAENGIVIIINATGSIYAKGQKYDPIANVANALVKYVIENFMNLNKHLNQNINLQDIYYLGPDDIQIDGQQIVRGNPENYPEDWNNAAAWAKNKLALKSEIPLYMLLIGHGFFNEVEPWTFRVNPYGSPDDIFLTSDDLNNFIESMTSLEEHPVYILMESCYSGGFIEDLRKRKETPKDILVSSRTKQKCLEQSSPFIVASSAANLPSLLKTTPLSLDSSFLYSVWRSIFHGGISFSKAFENAINKPDFDGQKPQSCDGTFKDNNLGDKVISNRVSAAPPPHINISEKDDKIECQVKYVEKGFDLDSVWASIKPPNYSHLPVYPKTGLAYDNVPTIPLSKEIKEKKVLYTGQFNGFVKEGKYEIRCYVKNIKGDIYKSEPITISKGHSIKVDVNLDIPSTIQRGAEFKVSRTATGQGEYDEYEAVVFPDGKFFIIVAPDVIFDFSRVEPFSRKRIVLSPEGDTQKIVSFKMPNEIPTGKYEWYSIFVVPGGNPLETDNRMGFDTKEFEVVE